MKTTEWANFGEWVLKFLKIWRGNPYKWVCLSAFGVAVLFINNSWITFVLMFLGVITPEQIGAWANPSQLQYILASLIAMGGILGFAFGSYMDSRAQKSASSTIVALKHQSFEGNLRPLSAKDLPTKVRKALIIAESLDQTQFYRNGVMQSPEVALNMQSGLAHTIKAHLGAHNNTHLAYYGKAHIPFVFAAGYALQADPSVILFELERDNGQWRVLQDVETEDLGIQVDWNDDEGGDAVVRISISYLVEEEDVTAVVPTPYMDAHIRISSPKIDAISSKRQVNEIAEKFREVLDKFQKMEQPPGRIHIFCTAPMSVVFSLGRRLSPTIHPEVIVYNYTASTTPRYSWAVALNTTDNPKIVRLETPDQESEDVRSA